MGLQIFVDESYDKGLKECGHSVSKLFVSVVNSNVDEGSKRHNEQPAIAEGNDRRLRATDTETGSGVRCRNLLHLGEERLWLRQGLLHCYGM
jgi:hypothetical protein